MLVLFLASFGFFGEPEHLNQVNGKFSVKIPGHFNVITYRAELSNSACEDHDVPKTISASIVPYVWYGQNKCHYATKVSYENGETLIEFAHDHGIYSNIGLLGKIELICDGSKYSYYLDRDNQEEVECLTDKFRWEFVTLKPRLEFFPDELNGYSTFASWNMRPKSSAWIQFRYKIDEESETGVSLRVNQYTQYQDGGFRVLSPQNFPLTRSGGRVKYKGGRQEIRPANWRVFRQKVSFDPTATEVTFAFRADDTEKMSMIFVEDLKIIPMNQEKKTP